MPRCEPAPLDAVPSPTLEAIHAETLGAVRHTTVMTQRRRQWIKSDLTNLSSLPLLLVWQLDVLYVGQQRGVRGTNYCPSVNVFFFFFFFFFFFSLFFFHYLRRQASPARARDVTVQVSHSLFPLLAASPERVRQSSPPRAKIFKCHGSLFKRSSWILTDGFSSAQNECLEVAVCHPRTCDFVLF